MLGVTPDSPNPILVRKGLPKHGFPRGSCGEGDKVRVQDGCRNPLSVQIQFRSLDLRN